jgi:2-desacetyl-2-hydroxyethyl bacteriochlorophyllide A dehydrogenase
MRAIVLESPGALLARALPDPHAPGPGQTLIRIRQVGVCGTDYHAFRGNQPFFTYPRILGHELGVEVVAIGAATPDLCVGDKCALRPYFNCGHCSACLRGKTNCCPSIQVFGVHSDGGMREYALVPTSHLHPASKLTFEQLALVEPLAIGAHAVARALLTHGERVLVIGVGPIGLAVTQFALLAGNQVTVMDISDQRLAFCQQLWPSITCINGYGLTSDMIDHRLGDDLPTVVFEATGNPQSMQTAFSYVGFGGRMIFVGLFSGDVTFHDPLFHSREVTLLGSRNALAEDFAQIITALEAEKFAITSWVTHRASLEMVAEVFPQWLNPQSGIIKGLIAI